MKLHNTLTSSIEELKTLTPNEVKLYTCGLTVYSQPHIGNWLGYIYWDVLVRTLESEGYAVKRTQNITDVGHLVSDGDDGEDKMEKGARIEGITAWDVAKKYSDIAEHEAYDLLRLKRPTHLIPATSLIEEQIAFAKGLEDKGLTYLIESEGLYFDTSKLADYGKLARLDIAGLEAGKRVATNGKKFVTDFAIWKLSPQDAKRDMEWDSPWGKGFPGWHLECSVIARETLGDQIDIHTGGIDHIPVHHTNEIAQTEGLTGKEFAHTWLHNNHIKIDGTKISKSIGNIITLEDILTKGLPINAFKLVALSKHYRTEGNFDWTILEAANNRLKGWRATAALRHQLNSQDESGQHADAISKLKAALSNDLGTPEALAIIDATFAKIEASLASAGTTSLTQFLTVIDQLLGIDLLSDTPDIDDANKALIKQREDARTNKDWAASDILRDKLLEQGIQVKDTGLGTIWSYA